MHRALYLLVLLPGCDQLFRLSPVPAPTGEVIDAPTDPAVKDAPTRCAPIGHDEDGDGKDDVCDSCPIDIDSGVDADGDGLDDKCDPAIGPQNTVLFMTGFSSDAQFNAEFAASATASWSASNNGQVTLFSSATLTTRSLYAATKIDVRTSQVGVGAGAAANVSHSGATCILLGSSCDNTTTTKACVKSLPGNGQGELSVSSANISRVELLGPTPITCAISAALNGPATATTTLPFGTTALQFTTNAGSALILDAVVIYGLK